MLITSDIIFLVPLSYCFRFAVLCLLLLSGCVIPRGSKVGPDEVLGTRTNSAGQVTEKITVVPTFHHAFMPFSPEGMQWATVSSVTRRCYFENATGARSELRFLRSLSFALVAPVSDTNLWVAVTFLHASGETGYKYRVTCFNPFGKVSSGTVSCSGYGFFTLDGDRNQLVYNVTATEHFKTRVIDTQFYALPEDKSDKELERVYVKHSHI